MPNKLPYYYCITTITPSASMSTYDVKDIEVYSSDELGPACRMLSLRMPQERNAVL